MNKELPKIRYGAKLTKSQVMAHCLVKLHDAFKDTSDNNSGFCFLAEILLDTKYIVTFDKKTGLFKIK